MKVNHSIAAAIAAVMVSGCGAIENMETVKDLTAEMNEEVKGTHETASHTYRDLRQGDSQQIRREQMSLLKEKGDLASKQRTAAIYFMSFEFQLAKADETYEERAELYDSAIQELMGHVRDFMDPNLKIDPLTTDENLKSLIALSMALHKTNPNQQGFAGGKPVSMLDIIQLGFTYKKAIESTKEEESTPPQFAYSVLLFENEAKYLLNLRYNGIIASLIPQLYDLGKDPAAQGATLALMAQKAWTPNYDHSLMNSVQAGGLVKRLEAAIQLGEFLNSEDVQNPPKLNRVVASIFKNMKPRYYKVANARPQSKKEAVARKLEEIVVTQLQPQQKVMTTLSEEGETSAQLQKLVGELLNTSELRQADTLPENLPTLVQQAVQKLREQQNFSWSSYSTETAQ